MAVDTEHNCIMYICIYIVYIKNTLWAWKCFYGVQTPDRNYYTLARVFKWWGKGKKK